MAIPRWEILLGHILGFLVGLALIAAGLGLWVKNPGPTISTVTVSTTIGADTHHKGHTTSVATTTLDGQQAQAATAKSPGAVPQRSAAVTVGLVAAGVVLMLGSSSLVRLRALSVPPKAPKPAAAEDDAADDDDDE
jgi:hypothetical protein